MGKDNAADTLSSLPSAAGARPVKLGIVSSQIHSAQDLYIEMYRVFGCIWTYLALQLICVAALVVSEPLKLRKLPGKEGPGLPWASPQRQLARTPRPPRSERVTEGIRRGIARSEAWSNFNL